MARIVIVDDDQLVCAIVARTLTPLGHVVTAVRDGDDALDSLWESAPDLVILDCALPGKTGLTILRELRESAMFVDLPVLILTARRSEWHAKASLGAGANAYVRKPFDAVELIAKIDALLAPSPPRAAAVLPPTAAVPSDLLVDPARLADLRDAVGEDDANRLLAMMLSDIGTRTTEIAAALARGDAPRAVQEAHALRGACDGIGANDLARLCLAVERSETTSSEKLQACAVRTMAEIERMRAAVI